MSNERARAESVVDVRTDTIVNVLRFDSETLAVDARTHRVYAPFTTPQP